MNYIFAIQLLISFIVGGGFITLLSFLAEKADKKIAGIIITFPTTIALSYFFLGWTQSSEVISSIVPTSMIILGISVLFAIAYAHSAQYFNKISTNKILKISLTFIVSIILWLILAIPIVLFQISSLIIGVIGYLTLVSFSYLLIKNTAHQEAIQLNYTLKQKTYRGIFVGLVIFLVVLFGKILNPFWSGMFATFPIVFLLALIIIHWYHGSKYLFVSVIEYLLGRFLYSHMLL